MPNGERTTQTGYGEHGKTTVPLTGSTKNAAQLLHQNIKQDASRQGKCGAYPKRLLSVHTHRLSRYDLIGIDARPFVAPRQSVAHRQEGGEQGAVEPTIVTEQGGLRRRTRTEHISQTCTHIQVVIHHPFAHPRIGITQIVLGGVDRALRAAEHG